MKSTTKSSTSVKKTPVKKAAVKSKTTPVSRSAVKKPTPAVTINDQNISKDATADNILAYAKLFIGTPYRYGGNSPAGFDCSGYTSYVFARFGIKLPRSSRDQLNVGTPVSREELQPGDLLLFGSPVTHVGIYVGNNQYIHSPQTGERVKIATLNRFTFARRILK